LAVNQKQIQHLRRIIRELSKHVTEKLREAPDVKELASWGFKTTMHVVRLVPDNIPFLQRLPNFRLFFFIRVSKRSHRHVCIGSPRHLRRSIVSIGAAKLAQRFFQREPALQQT
jgi:Patatin phospholipase